MKPRLLLALAVLLMAALSMSVQAGEQAGPMVPDPDETRPLAGTDYRTGPAVRDGVWVDVVFGECVCGWR